MGDDSGCFGAAAMRLLGVMAHVCGWRPEEFWQATPADAAAVLAGCVQGLGVDGGGEVGGFADPRQLAALMEKFPDG